MTVMTVRELSHNTSAVLEQVMRGDVVYVTKFGKVIAVINPAGWHISSRQTLEATGVISGSGESAVAALHRLGPPLRAVPGAAPLSDVLAELRDEDER